MMKGDAAGRRSRLGHFGLDDKSRVSWALYDWANSAFATTIMAAVLPIYYANVAGKHLAANTASAYWGYTTALALLLIAIASPVLGAAADLLGAKRRFMGFFVTLGVTFTAALWFVREGDWLLGSAIFILANIGFAGANVFYDSLLAHVVDEARSDRLSAAGYALGYLGGGILLVINLAWILKPESFGIADSETASRLAMLSVAVWWAIFSIPLFRNVPEPHPSLTGERKPAAGEIVRMSFARLGRTLHHIRAFRQLAIFLLAFLIYNDGIGTIIKMATVYGNEIGIQQKDLIGALVLTQFAGIPFALAFGALAERVGAKRGIYVALLGYTGISILGYFMTEAWHFWALALAIATVQGGSQALSRSLFSSMVPRHKSSEFFGFFSVSAKFAGIFGPLIFALVSQATGSSRLSILSLIGFFVVGMLILSFVDVEAGQDAARQAELEFAS